MHEASPVSLCSVSPVAVGKKSPQGPLTAPDDLCPRAKGAGGCEPVLLDESCDSSELSGCAVRLL